MGKKSVLKGEQDDLNKAILYVLISRKVEGAYLLKLYRNHITLLSYKTTKVYVAPFA